MSDVCEINFDGLIGPSHNYGGMSPGNLASTRNLGATSYPRAAALQGLTKMRSNLDLGLPQGIFMPLDRPNLSWLTRLGTNNREAEPHVRAAAWSASSMWAANAATVSPAADCADGLCHLTVANLVTMAHRSHEWMGTLAQLRLAFPEKNGFCVHSPLPPCYGDEGAANHMRLFDDADAPGVEVFVYGIGGGGFPVRQHLEASKSIARLHQLDPERTVFAAQSEEAIAAGAFHNDVVAVANGNVLFAHEQAFADKAALCDQLAALIPNFHLVEVPASAVSLADAVQSYLFNAQLVTLPDANGPDGAGMALILPIEAQENENVWTWLEAMIAGNGPIRRLIPVDVRQSMANGGGPACLRLRVVADPSAVDPRFMLDNDSIDRIAAIVERYWPESIAPEQLDDQLLAEQVHTARATLLGAMGLGELE